MPDVLERKDCIACNVLPDGNFVCFMPFLFFEGVETQQFMSNSHQLQNELMDYLVSHQNDKIGNCSGFIVRDWMCTNLDEIIEQRRTVISNLNVDPRRKHHVEERNDRVLQYVGSTITCVKQYT